MFRDLLGQQDISSADLKKHSIYIDKKMQFTNARRGFYILWLGVILELGLIILFDVPNMVNNGLFSELGLYYFILHFVLFSISLVGLIWCNKIKKSQVIKKSKTISFNTFTIIMATLFLVSITLINILDQHESSSIALYTVYIILIGVIVLMKPGNMLIVMAIAHIVFVFGMILVVDDQTILTTNLINGSISAICAWFASYIFYTNYFQLTYKTIVIEETTKKLEILSNTDPLTNVFNRRYLYKYLSTEEFESIAKGRVSFIMFDIDSFKRINDSYGHIVGDEMLIAFSKILLNLSNDLEMVVRWGGEEFVWVLLNRTDEEIKKLSKQILKDCASIYSTIITKKIGITVSGGVCSMEEYDYQDLDRLISVTDKALYEAKDKGKSQIVFIKDYKGEKQL